MKTIANFFQNTLSLRLQKGNISIFGTEVKKSVLLILTGTTVFFQLLLFALAIFILSEIRMDINEAYFLFPAVFLFLSGFALLIYFFMKAFSNGRNYFILAVTLLSAVTFAVEKYLLNSELFPVFSFRTEVILWTAFSALFAAVFRKNIPVPALIFLTVPLIAGMFITIPFIIQMAPLMLFSWILFFTGIAVLPYAPLFAFFAFAAAGLSVYRTVLETKNRRLILIFRGTAALTFTLILSYTGYFFFRWNSITETFMAQEASSVHSADGDLPTGLRAAKYLYPDHILKIYLKMDYDRSFRDFFGFMKKGKGEYDFLGYTASLFFQGLPQEEHNAREIIIQTLFQEDYTAFETIWGDENLQASNVATHIQIYPSIRAAYVESILTIRNDGKRQGEAVYTIHVPEGSSASRLGLWIDGREETGRLALKSRAKKAYEQIVNIESRDPSLLEWKDGSRYRLKVFPVPAGGHRTVRAGFTVPLEQNGSLIFTPPVWKGPIHKANMSVNVELFSGIQPGEVQIENIGLSEKLVSDGQKTAYDYEGRYTDGWKVRIASPVKLEGSFSFQNHIYSAAPPVHIIKNIEIKNIFLVLDGSRDRDEWMSAYDALDSAKPENSHVYILSDRLFHSDDRTKISKFIHETNLPNFNLFPFYMLKEPEKSFIVASNSDLSVPCSSIRKSDAENGNFYNRTEAFFKNLSEPVPTGILGRGVPAYLKCMAEMNRIQISGENLDEITGILKTRKIRVVRQNADTVYLPSSDIVIKKFPGSEGNSGREENSNLMRLFAYNRSLAAIGKKNIPASENSEIYRLVQEANTVSPVSSLIVLESEHDYRRFGISKNENSLKPAKIQKADGDGSPFGMVPEPEEYALIAILILIFAYFSRNRLKESLKILTGAFSRGKYL